MMTVTYTSAPAFAVVYAKAEEPDPGDTIPDEESDPVDEPVDIDNDTVPEGDE